MWDSLCAKIKNATHEERVFILPHKNKRTKEDIWQKRMIFTCTVRVDKCIEFMGNIFHFWVFSILFFTSNFPREIFSWISKACAYLLLKQGLNVFAEACGIRLMLIYLCNQNHSVPYNIISSSSHRSKYIRRCDRQVCIAFSGKAIRLRLIASAVFCIY